VVTADGCFHHFTADRCEHFYFPMSIKACVCLDWVLFHGAHFTVLRFIFACIMCIIVYCMHV